MIRKMLLMIKISTNLSRRREDCDIIKRAHRLHPRGRVLDSAWWTGRRKMTLTATGMNLTNRVFNNFATGSNGKNTGRTLIKKSNGNPHSLTTTPPLLHEKIILLNGGKTQQFLSCF